MIEINGIRLYGASDVFDVDIGEFAEEDDDDDDDDDDDEIQDDDDDDEKFHSMKMEDQGKGYIL